MAKICKHENCSNPVFGQGYCKFHYPKKNLKKSKSKPLKKSWLSKAPSEKQKLKNIEKAERTKKLHQWFNLLWENEPHYSEISNKWLGNENNTCFWHHLYPKSTYPEYEFDRDNIIRLTANEHTECEANPIKFEIINEKRAYIKQKYGK